LDLPLSGGRKGKTRAAKRPAGTKARGRSGPDSGTPKAGRDADGKTTARKKKRPQSGGRGGGGRGGGGRGGGNGGGDSLLPPPIPDTSLAAEAERRYLTYALSVITSRALPDVRDGLKPVQRRILYAMYHDLHLNPDGRYRKSAAVVGEVMGKYHPHGDVAIYDAMVRMAQPFSMSAALVDGQGNFGSPDGDGAAAMRYTEAKLQKLAIEMLAELGKRTVDFRPNYDGTRQEPMVLPSRFPNLLVNGSYGIAVGMATSVPPHNLGEVIDACVRMIDDSEVSLTRLLKRVKGPDFPTGGELIADKADLRAIYETGHGSLKLRGEWEHVPSRRRGESDQVVITSTPYAIERRAVVEKIAELIIKKKVPQLLDIRDESTEVVRVVLELKRGTDPTPVMAYLFRHTPLQTSVQFNLTALAPQEGTDVAAPARMGLQQLLSEFLDFRFDTVTKRLEYELEQLLDRIHVLEGFEIVFDALDQAIRIIRKSDGKADAAAKLIGRFGLSAVQADAILELKLYRLSKLEILAIEKELAEKRAAAKKLKALLRNESARWKLVKEELLDVKANYAVKRRTRVVGAVDEVELQEQDFILKEDAKVILCASGWIKRVGKVKDVNATRMREGDSVLGAVAGATTESIAFFSNQGACYVARIHDIPAATGYGDPIQKLFKLGDGERIVSLMSFDPRVIEVPVYDPDDEPKPPFAIAVTRKGLGLRFSLRPHRDPSTRAGRKFARLNKGDEVLAVYPLGTRRNEDDWIMCAADDGHAIAVDCAEVSLLAGAGKGVMVMKLAKATNLIGAEMGWRDLDSIGVTTAQGKERSLTLRSLQGSRGGRGSWIVKRGGFAKYLSKPVETPTVEGS
jgi:DNA gyrase subunit A